MIYQSGSFYFAERGTSHIAATKVDFAQIGRERNGAFF
jgi:hypothetical protein